MHDGFTDDDVDVDTDTAYDAAKKEGEARLWDEDPYSVGVVDGDEVPDDVVTGWTVDSEDRAAWAVHKVLSAREGLARIRTQCRDWERRAERELERLEEWVLPQLELYLRAHPPVRGKTLHLPTGSLFARKVPGGARVRDKDLCVAWARQHLPAAVQATTTHSVLAAVIKHHVDSTGEIPAGVSVIEDKEITDVKGPKS